MDLETKCPHCDQWTASNVESCSKCGGLLFKSKEGANPFISTLKKNWKLAIGLAGAVLILFVLFFRPNPTPPPEKQAQNLPTEKQKEPPSQKPSLPPKKPKPSQQKPDLSGQLGFYGQWDKNKDGYLKGTEIVAAMTELNKVEMNVTDISGESAVVKFRWEPPRDIDFDQRISREELTRSNRDNFRFHGLFKAYDFNKDGLLSKAEIEKEPVPDIAGNRGKQLLFEPLKKFDLNQDGKLALLEIPPYHSYFMRSRGRGGGERGKESSGGGSGSRAGIIPGKSEINEALLVYEGEFGQKASSLEDLVNAGFYDSMEKLQSTAPIRGTWVIDPSTGMVKLR